MLTVVVVLCGGCMKIYPDPELPDITAIWYDGDCTEESTDVELTLLDEAGASIAMLRAPCRDTTATFADVPRERLRVDGVLHNSAGMPVIPSPESEVDLRDGLDDEAYLSFFLYDNFSIGWEFEGSASCDSVSAETVVVELTTAGQPAPVVFEDLCFYQRLTNAVPEGTYTATVRALDVAGTTVANSPPTDPFTVVVDTFEIVDFGIVVLTPAAN